MHKWLRVHDKLVVNLAARGSEHRVIMYVITVQLFFHRIFMFNVTADIMKSSMNCLSMPFEPHKFI